MKAKLVKENLNELYGDKYVSNASYDVKKEEKEEISIEEFNKFIDWMINRNFKYLSELNEALHNFLDKHPYITNNSGRFYKKDKYFISLKRLIKYYSSRILDDSGNRIPKIDLKYRDI